MAENLKPCVFLDRDGTITEEVGYVNHVARLRLIPGAAKAIRKLNDAGVLAICVSNQAGVARGYFTIDLLKDTMARMEALLAEKQDARLDGIYFCPHHPDGKPPYNEDSRDRKPKPGMVEKACADFPVDMDRSYMVGDRKSDVTFGHALGLRTVLLLTGYGRGEWEHQREQFDYEPVHVADDLLAAVDWIIEDLALSRIQAESAESSAED
jgi:D-glycero-D-manno-heptose 1,7-bisphosphate phosphatase